MASLLVVTLLDDQDQSSHSPAAFGAYLLPLPQRQLLVLDDMMRR